LTTKPSLVIIILLVMFLMTETAGATTTYLNDTFIRSDNSSIGSNWTGNVASYNISNNNLTRTGTNAQKPILANSTLMPLSATGYIVEDTFNETTIGGFWRTLIYMQNTTSTYGYGYAIIVADDANQKIYLKRTGGGTDTLVSSFAITQNSWINTTHTIKIVSTTGQAKFNIFKDGIYIGYVEDITNTYTSGYCGLDEYYGGKNVSQDFKCYNPDGTYLDNSTGTEYISNGEYKLTNGQIVTNITVLRTGILNITSAIIQIDTSGGNQSNNITSYGGILKLENATVSPSTTFWTNIRLTTTTQTNTGLYPSLYMNNSTINSLGNASAANGDHNGAAITLWYLEAGSYINNTIINNSAEIDSRYSIRPHLYNNITFKNSQNHNLQMWYSTQEGNVTFTNSNFSGNYSNQDTSSGIYVSSFSDLNFSYNYITGVYDYTLDFLSGSGIRLTAIGNVLTNTQKGLVLNIILVDTVIQNNFLFTSDSNTYNNIIGGGNYYQNNNTYINNIIDSSNNYSDGVRSYWGSDINITGLYILNISSVCCGQLSGQSGKAAFVLANMSNSTVDNVIITTQTTPAASAVLLSNLSGNNNNNIFTNLTSTGSFQYGMTIQKCENCTFRDINTSGTINDVSLTGGNISLINSKNISYNVSNASSQLNNSYYFDGLCQDSLGNNLSGCTITSNETMLNRIEQTVSSVITDISGHTPLPIGNDSTTVILMNMSKNSTYQQNMSYTVNVNDSSKIYSNINTTINSTGYISPNQPVASATIYPNSSWYRPNPNTYQNTTTIQLPPATNWSILPNITITINASSDKNLTASWPGIAQVYFNTTIPEWQGQPVYLIHDNVQVSSSIANATGFISFSYSGLNDTFNVTNMTGAIETPPTPVIDNVSMGNFWINYSWKPVTGNLIDSYNVSINNIWTNGTTNNYNNTSVGMHGWSNITLFSFNNSGVLSEQAPIKYLIGNNITNSSIISLGHTYIGTDMHQLSANISSYSNKTDPYSGDNTNIEIWFKLDESNVSNGAILNDSSGNNHNGTIVGTTLLSRTGKYNNGINVSTTSSRLNISSPNFINSSGNTVIYWLNPRGNSTPSSTQYLFSSLTSGVVKYSLTIGQNTGGFKAVLNGTTVTLTSSPPTWWNNSKFNQIALVWNDTIVNWYENGALVSTQSISILNSVNPDYFILFNHPASNLGEIGWYDDFKKYNRMFSSNDIYNDYAIMAEGIQVKLDGNNSYSSVWNSSSDNPISIPYSPTDVNTYLSFLAPQNCSQETVLISDCYQNMVFSANIKFGYTLNTQLNNAPILSPIPTQEWGTEVQHYINLSATDADNDTITYGTNATKGVFNTTTGQFSWTPTISDVGTYTWLFNASDGYDNGTDTQIVTINVRRAYFVSLSGDNTNNGSLNYPFRNISTAFGVISAGNYLYIRGGEYFERMIINKSGTSGNSIFISGYPNEVAILNGTNVSITAFQGIIFISGYNWLDISNLILKDTNRSDIRINAGNNINIHDMYFGNSSSHPLYISGSHNAIQYLNIYNNSFYRHNTDVHVETLSISTCSHCEVFNNDVGYNGNGEGIDFKQDVDNSSIHDNNIHNITVTALYVDGFSGTVSDIEVYNNNIYNNTLDGFSFGSEQGGLVENVTVYNNVAYNNGISGFAVSGFNAIGTHANYSNLTITSNTAYGNGWNGGWGGGITLYLRNTSAVVTNGLNVSNNIVSKNIGWTILNGIANTSISYNITNNLIDGFMNFSNPVDGNETKGANYVEGNPLFINTSNNDFHIYGNSPANGTGLHFWNTPIVDKDGTIQRNPPDIGAYVASNEILLQPAINFNLNNYTNDGNTSIVVPINESVIFSVGSNQTIQTWTWISATKLTGDGTTNSTALKTFTISGNTTVSVSGTNNNGSTQTFIFTIFVASAPTIPILLPVGNQEWGTEAQQYINLHVVNVNDITVVYSTNSTNGTINATTGIFSWTPELSDIGSHVIRFNATNGLGESSINVTINVRRAYYVALDGNNTNNGSKLFPLRNISYAFGIVSAGNIIYIRGGEYFERMLVTNNGTFGNPIIASGYPLETAIINGTNVYIPSYEGLVQINNSNFIDISNMNIKDASQSNLRLVSGNNDSIHHITFGDSYSHSLWVYSGDDTGLNNHISDLQIFNNTMVRSSSVQHVEMISLSSTTRGNIYNNIITGNAHGEGIVIKEYSNNINVFGNYVSGCTVTAIYPGAYLNPIWNINIYDNVVHNNTLDAFSFGSERGGLVSNSSIWNNIAYNNGQSGFAVSGYAEPGYHVNYLNNSIVNNVAYNNGLSGWGGGITLYARNNSSNINLLYVVNNIVSQNDQWSILDGIVNTSNTYNISYNLIYGFHNYSSPYDGNETKGVDYVEGNPLFFNASVHDFHIYNNSPAKGKGLHFWATPTLDFDGIVRTNPPDIGAYQASNEVKSINITSWSNNFTNDQSLTFVANLSTINFNVTTNITSDLYSWSINGVDQSQNFDNISIPFTINGTYYINATVYNSTYMTSDSISWKVILPTYNISGYVKDTLNNPIQGATVSCPVCNTIYSTTDPNGFYELSTVHHAFNSTISASMSGYTSQSMLVNSTGEDITNLNFTLKEITYPYSNATGSVIPWNSTASWSEPNNGSNLSILTGSGITEVFVTLDARVNTTNAFLYARIKEDGNEIARYNITSSTYELTTSFIVNNTDNPGTHYYSLELSSSNNSNSIKTKAVIYKWSMYIRSDSGTVVMSNDNVTAVRSLDTSYINSNSRSINVFVTAKAQITADNGTAIFFGNSTTGQLSGKIGIESGLLGQNDTSRLIFVVAPNSDYTINSSANNGSVTLEDWREVSI